MASHYIEFYVDYIDYTAFTFDGAFKEGDGGMIMLKKPYSELSCEDIIGLILDELEIKHEIYCIQCLKEAPVTRTYRVYGREGHRQKISFEPSVTWNFSGKYDGIRILTIRNSDVMTPGSTIINPSPGLSFIPGSHRTNAFPRIRRCPYGTYCPLLFEFYRTVRNMSYL